MTGPATADTFPSVFRPLRVGTMALDHRLVVPPHGGGAGSLVGTEELFEQHCATGWPRSTAARSGSAAGRPSCATRCPRLRADRCRVPTVRASSAMPNFVARLGRAWPAGARCRRRSCRRRWCCRAACRSAPSADVSGYNDHRVPHALDLDEVAWLVREYGESAALAAEAGVDAIELHANHDDVLQWFLSPLTNHRDDGYGGGFEGRRRLLREVVESIREHVDRPITLGLRLCLDEMIDGGYGLDECQAMIAAFTAEGTVDYFSLDVGNNWGVPSYIPVHSLRGGRVGAAVRPGQGGHRRCRSCTPGGSAEPRHRRADRRRRAGRPRRPRPGRHGRPVVHRQGQAGRPSDRRAARASG